MSTGKHNTLRYPVARGKCDITCVSTNALLAGRPVPRTTTDPLFISQSDLK